METEKQEKNNAEEVEQDKNGLLVWMKDHKTQLTIAGVGTAAFIATALGIKNKESIGELFKLWQEDLKKGKPLSGRWFKNATIEELEKARKVIQDDYRNPKLDMDHRTLCHNLLFTFDKAISEKKWAGRIPQGPSYSREHGRNLYKPD